MHCEALSLATLAAAFHDAAMTTPLRPIDAEAHDIIAMLLAEVRHCALAFTDPATGAPSASRIALLWIKDMGFMTLISELSQHTGALKIDPRCALLIGEAAAKGDALTAPRLTVHATVEQFDKSALREPWCARLPKSKLYFDFTDFVALRFVPKDAFLNGGFGKAYRFGADDLGAMCPDARDP